MTRIDMTARDLHGLLAPVLPHASTDPELPSLCTVRLEVAGDMAYAAATDRYSLAVSRMQIPGGDPGDDVTIHVGAKDAGTALKLFPYSKDDDPQLRITLDSFRVAHGGRNLGPMALGLEIESEDGTRVVLHDQRDPLAPTVLDSWRTMAGRVIHRDHTQPARSAMLLNPVQLARWGKSAARGERFVMLPGGGEPGEPILITVEDHFLGLWIPQQHLDGDAASQLTGSPWLDELPSP